MKLHNIANIIDLEHDNAKLIEIGLTTVSLKEKKILQTYSIPIRVKFEMSKDITELTGWTNAKLNKRGVTLEEAVRRLDIYGSKNRLLITDHSDEIPFLVNSLHATFSNHRLNISILFALKTGNDINLGLEKMLAFYDMALEGKLHSASDDSRNIARLFLRLI